MELAIVSALAFGAGAVMGAAGTIFGKDSEADHAVRDAMKQGLTWSMEVFDQAQGAIAEAGESFNDLMAEARLEANKAKQTAVAQPPSEVPIETD